MSIILVSNKLAINGIIIIVGIKVDASTKYNVVLLIQGLTTHPISSSVTIRFPYFMSSVSYLTLLTIEQSPTQSQSFQSCPKGQLSFFFYNLYAVSTNFNLSNVLYELLLNWILKSSLHLSIYPSNNYLYICSPKIFQSPLVNKLFFPQIFPITSLDYCS